MQENITVFGKLERIEHIQYLNGVPTETRFSIRRINRVVKTFNDRAEGYDFYGPIPLEYVGQEVKYSKWTNNHNDISQFLTEIKIGKIVVGEPNGRDGVYGLDQLENSDPRIPLEIFGVQLNRVRDVIIYPYFHNPQTREAFEKS